VIASGEQPIRLLIADDHPVVRDGLSGMFAADPDFSVVGEAGDGSQAVRLADAVRPDVILMDLRMPGMDGLTAIAELSRRGNPARVLVLTTYDTDSYVLPAIEAGATGYLLKDAPRDELLRAVRAAAAGQSVLAPSVATRLMNRVRAPEPELLSHRELEVLGLVAAGTTNRETAARLFISEATVKTHLLHIYAKLGVTDRAAAVAEAFNRGLLTPERPERRLLYGTLMGGWVLARTSSSSTPGASSTRTSPSVVTSRTHKSVMIRWTTPFPV
jgi:DNA-binding NarL/FixJ family response regulator